MFCPYCGNSVSEGHLFCNICGKPLASTPAPEAPKPAQPNFSDLQAQYQMQKEGTRKAELETLSNVYDHFAQKSGQFRDYDAVCERVNYFAQGAKSALLVWGCIAATLGLLFSLILLSDNEPPWPFLILFLIPGLAMIAGGILMKVNNRKKLNKFKEYYASLSLELYNHYIDYPNCPVGPEYVNPQILELCMSALRSGRADSIKESINMVLASVRQSRIKEYLVTLEKNVSDVNAASGIRMYFIPYSFFA